MNFQDDFLQTKRGHTGAHNWQPKWKINGGFGKISSRSSRRRDTSDSLDVFYTLSPRCRGSSLFYPPCGHPVILRSFPVIFDLWPLTAASFGWSCGLLVGGWSFSPYEQSCRFVSGTSIWVSGYLWLVRAGIIVLRLVAVCVVAHAHTHIPLDNGTHPRYFVPNYLKLIYVIFCNKGGGSVIRNHTHQQEQTQKQAHHPIYQVCIFEHQI